MADVLPPIIDDTPAASLPPPPPAVANVPPAEPISQSPQSPQPQAQAPAPAPAPASVPASPTTTAPAATTSSVAETAPAPAPNPTAWMHEWSTQELRSNAKTWNLGCDFGLLTYLKSFSVSLMARTQALESQVNGLVHQSRVAEVNLHNTFNQFMMLSNTQYIENRVYDDDSTENTTPASEEANSDKNSAAPETPSHQQIMEKCAAALSFGIDEMIKFYGVPEAKPEPVPVAPVPDAANVAPVSADGVAPVASQEATTIDKPAQPADSIPAKPAQMPNDPWSNLPLPMVYGTQPYNEDPNCGLFIESEPEPEPESESSDEEIEVPPVDTTTPVLAPEVSSATTAAPVESSESLLPAVSDKDGDFLGFGSNEPPKPEDVAKIADIIGDTTALPDPAIDDDPLFSKPPAEKTDDTLPEFLGDTKSAAPEKPKTSSLFEDDGDDIFSPITKSSADEDLLLFADDVDEKKLAPQKKTMPIAKPAPQVQDAFLPTVLQDEDEPITKQSTAPVSAVLPSVDSEDEEPTAEKEPTVKKGPESFSSQLEKSLAQQLGGMKKPPTLQKKYDAIRQAEKVEPKEADADPLFTEDDDLFGKTVTNSKQQTKDSPTLDSTKSEPKAAIAVPSAKKKEALFSVSDDEGDSLFGSSKPAPVKKAQIEPEVKPKPQQKKESLLFDDDSFDSFMDEPKPKSTPKPAVAPKEETKAPENPAVSSAPAKSEAKEPPPASVPTKKKEALFNISDEDSLTFDSDSTSAIKAEKVQKSQPETQKPPAKKATLLFEDDASFDSLTEEPKPKQAAAAPAKEPPKTEVQEKPKEITTEPITEPSTAPKSAPSKTKKPPTKKKVIAKKSTTDLKKSVTKKPVQKKAATTKKASDTTKPTETAKSPVEEAIPVEEEKEPQPEQTPASTAVDPLGLPPIEEEQPVVAPQKKSKSGKLDDLKAKIDFKPEMLTGGKPPKKPKQTEIQGDGPRLECATKTRAKPAKGRRPPTLHRSHNTSAPADDADMLPPLSDEPDDTIETPLSLSTEPTPSPKLAANDSEAKHSGSKDILDLFDNPLAVTSDPNKKPVKKVPTRTEAPKGVLLGDETAPAATPAAAPTKKASEPVGTVSDDPLFSSAAPSEKKSSSTLDGFGLFD